LSLSNLSNNLLATSSLFCACGVKDIPLELFDFTFVAVLILNIFYIVVVVFVVTVDVFENL
jgi:hypothetical protein